MQQNENNEEKEPTKKVKVLPAETFGSLLIQAITDVEVCNLNEQGWKYDGFFLEEHSELVWN